MCPAQFGTRGDYDALVAALEAAGHPAYVAPLRKASWVLGLAPSFFSADFWRGELKPDVRGLELTGGDAADARAAISSQREREAQQAERYSETRGASPAEQAAQQRLAGMLGMAPGGEFRAAAKAGAQVPGCTLFYGDRPVGLTLRRAFSQVSAVTAVA